MAATYASSPPYYPTGIPPEGGTISKRVDRPDYVIDPETGCWIWQGATNPDGSPRCQATKPTTSKRKIARGETKPILIVYSRAHREYYRRAHGEIPHGTDLVRSCPNQSCVNPDHYHLVPHDQMLAQWHQENKSPLTQADVDEIRAGVKAGVKQEVYERRFGLANASVSNIARNLTWKDPDYEPGVEKVCALSGCRKRFVTTNSRRRFCTRKHNAIFQWRYRTGYYDREAERKAARRAHNAVKRAAEAAWSLDSPVRDDSATTLGELVHSAGAYDTTVAQVEANLVRGLLGDLTLDDIGRLDDDALVRLRLRLARAGIAPPSVRCHVPA